MIKWNVPAALIFKGIVESTPVTHTYNTWDWGHIPQSMSKRPKIWLGFVEHFEKQQKM
jgi:hypothetical protein